MSSGALHNFVTRSSRSSQSQARASASNSALTTPTYHFAASRRLEKGKQKAVDTHIDSLASQASSEGSSQVVKDYPTEGGSQGVDFDVDWTNIWLRGEKLRPDRLGYRVRHKNNMRAGKARSGI